MSSTSTPTVQTTRLQSLATRLPVLLFLALALPSTLGLATLVALAEYEVIPGRSIPPMVGLDSELAASVLLVIALVASVSLVTYWEGGTPAVRLLYARALRWRVPLRWWAIAALALPFLTVTLSVLLGDQFDSPALSVVGNEIVALLIALFVINVWEELTWTGFMQTHLERRHNVVVAAAITGIPFSFVHMPLRVITGEATTPGALLTSFIILFVFCLFIRTTFGIVMRGALNSVLLVAVTHTTFNRSNNVDGITADLLNGSNRPIAAVLATVVLTIALVVVWRRRLSPQYRAQLDAAEPR